MNDAVRDRIAQAVYAQMRPYQDIYDRRDLPQQTPEQEAAQPRTFDSTFDAMPQAIDPRQMTPSPMSRALGSDELERMWAARKR